MRTLIMIVAAAAAFGFATQHTPRAQASEMAVESPFTDALIQDVATLESKLVSLAEAMPPEALDWRPGEGVLSGSEVLMHIAAYNYYYPSMAGAAIPAGAGVTSDYATVSAFENTERTRREMLGALQASFDHLKASVAAVTAEQLDDDTEVFGRSTTVQAAWFGTVTHIHEHLGQLIAYARSNDITPPWSM